MKLTVHRTMSADMEVAWVEEFSKPHVDVVERLHEMADELRALGRSPATFALHYYNVQNCRLCGANKNKEAGVRGSGSSSQPEKEAN